jgi:hypothetical protein
MQNHPASSVLRKQAHPPASAAVYDGPDAVGSVVLASGGQYIAIDVTGAEIGRFGSLRAATRAIPPAGSRRAAS